MAELHGSMALQFSNLSIYVAHVPVAGLQIHLCDGQSRLRIRKFTLPLPNNFALSLPLATREALHRLSCNDYLTWKL